MVEPMMRVGTFVKTPAPHIVEVLGLTGLDFCVLDAEHGPFDRASCDPMMIAGRACGLPIMIRIPDMAAPTVLWALDIGAHGLVVPHVDTAAQAAELVARARFNGGIRGLSNSARFAGYGTSSLVEAMALGDEAKLFCQIESAEAVDNAAAIANTAGVAGLVIGRADLALSIGETRMDAPAVLEGTRLSIAAARAAGKEAIIVSSTAEFPAFAAMGATMVIVSSDQGFLRTSAAVAAGEIKRIFDASDEVKRT
jgi:2-keto-3-deoxy-L-rhamnonate aldolase RhmA